jgi:hypothetical protein
MNKRKTFVRSAAAVATLLAGGLAVAHHSFAMFDNTKQQTVTGTVRTLEWTNPHVWLWVDVPDDKGGTVAYGFEGAAPGEMTRMGGWTKRSVIMGDKVTVQYRPLKDGRPGGSLGKVTTADGKTLGNSGRGGGPGGPGGPGGGGGPPGGPGADPAQGGPPGGGAPP